MAERNASLPEDGSNPKAEGEWQFIAVSQSRSRSSMAVKYGPADIYLKRYFIRYPLRESFKSSVYSMHLSPFYYGRVLSHLLNME